MQTRRVARIDQRDWVGEDALARLARVACHPHVVTRLLRESAFGSLAASTEQDARLVHLDLLLLVDGEPVHGAREEREGAERAV